MPIIYIEGNIGTGKSTFIENLKTYLDFFNDLNYDTHVILEPVNEWLQTTDSSGENILQKFNLLGRDKLAIYEIDKLLGGMATTPTSDTQN